MEKIYKILFYTVITLFVIVPFSGYAESNDSDQHKSTAVIRSIWKYEEDFTKYSYEDGIAKKVYFLSLNSDGTYHQYVQVVPSNPQNYCRIRSYEINGRWSEKNGKLVLEEYGKENSIDYNYLYSNFENIDNQFISKK
ncbi:MAG: hypothetical protein JWN78_3319 [Bacteroidota bacterium]|nr:hypothetical protein [Bacteroidota bacterium]